MRAQPPGDRQDDGVSGEVAGENPFAVIDRRRQTAGDITQRHHRDGGVEHLHERRYHDDGGHQPWVRRCRSSCGRKRRVRHLSGPTELWD